MEYPKLMVDSSDYDGHAEDVMDYVVSWCIRRSQKDLTDKPILLDYCKFMVCRLLDIEDYKSVEVYSVKTWKQWEHTDLVADIELRINHGSMEKHSILIEDKYYSPLHDATDEDGQRRNQLLVYKKKFDRYYTQNGDWHLHYALLSCMDPNDEKIHQYDIAKDYGFKVFAWGDLIPKEANLKPTESDIYNEFWLRW